MASSAAFPVVRTTETLRDATASWRRAGLSIGLVPTMGALHEGHLELVRRAQAECDKVIVTLFVNPKQFNDAADLASYPRNEDSDRFKLEACQIDLLFAPHVASMYPQGFATQVRVADLGNCLCGAARPGHMEGVSTVVTKLLMQSLPTRAYFGEKDFQQLLIIQRMVRDLDMPTEICPVETVRDQDGLALSSRNENLTAAQRAIAPRLLEVLQGCRDDLLSTRPVGEALSAGKDALVQAGFDGIDYFDFRHAETLALLDTLAAPSRLFVAAWLGDIRLIDNIAVA
ncbi:MAG: pantoate--beta-alanine ligase [Pseudomonadota bacterium]